MLHAWHAILYFTGTRYYGPTSQWYNFWSGFGSDIAEVAILGGVIQLYRKHNCHTTHCLRIAHHKFTDKATGTEYMLCKKHYRQVHPEVSKIVTIEHIMKLHKANKEITK